MLRLRKHHRWCFPASFPPANENTAERRTRDSYENELKFTVVFVKPQHRKDHRKQFCCKKNAFKTRDFTVSGQTEIQQDVLKGRIHPYKTHT